MRASRDGGVPAPLLVPAVLAVAYPALVKDVLGLLRRRSVAT